MSEFGNEQHATDQILIYFFQQGSAAEREEAFLQLYNRYSLYLFRFIKSRVSSSEDAKDIFADVWEIVVERLGKFVWPKHSEHQHYFKSWLFTIARNKMNEYFRKRNEERNLIIPLEELGSSSELKLENEDTSSSEVQERAKQEMDKALNDAFNNLNSKEREILDRTYVEGQNSSQIGQEMGIKSGTVRVNRSRALAKLRKLINYLTSIIFAI